jgi:hypothetical protein
VDEVLWQGYGNQGSANTTTTTTPASNAAPAAESSAEQPAETTDNNNNSSNTNQTCSAPPSPRNKKDLKCTYCGQTGHEEWDCWSKYPARRKTPGGVKKNKAKEGIPLKYATPSAPPSGGQGGQQSGQQTQQCELLQKTKQQLAQDAFRKAAEAGNSRRRRAEGSTNHIGEKVTRRGRGQMKFFDEFGGTQKTRIAPHAYDGGRYE